MAKRYNLARMTTPTTGAGPVALAAAVAGHISFADAGLKDGDSVAYAIVEGAGVEIGRGVYSIAGPSLTRQVIHSTNANLPLVLAGSAEVYLSEMAGGTGGIASTGEGLPPGEGPGIDVVGTLVGLGLDSILLAHADGSPASEYATITAALAAAATGETVLIAKPGTWAESVTIPAGVSLVGIDRQNVIITGQVTLSSGSLMANVSITRAGETALSGIVGPAADGDSARVLGCDVTVAVTGAGTGAGLEILGGDVTAEYCDFSGTSSAGAGYGVKVTGREVTGETAGTFDSWDMGASVHSNSGTGTLTNLGIPVTPPQSDGSTYALVQAPGDSGTAWVIYDLGAEYDITNLMVMAYYDGDVWLESSPDLSTWTELFAIRLTWAGASMALRDLMGPASVTARYLRFRVQEVLLTGNQWRIAYFTVTGTGYSTTYEYGAATLRWCKASGSTDDLAAGSGAISVYACQYDTANTSGTITALSGDRAAWDALADPDLHANDVNNAAGIHHTLTALDAIYAAADHTHPMIGLETQFLYNDASSDVSGYKRMLPAHSAAEKETISVASITDGQVLEEFVTEPGSPNADFLLAGVYTVHIHAAKTAGTKALQLYANIYKRAAGGTETLLGATSTSTALTSSEAEYALDVALAEMDIDTTDRLVVKIVATVTGAGTDPTGAIYVEGDTFAHVSFPALLSSGGAAHDAVTVADTSTIDLTLTGQQISAALKDTTVTPGSYTNADITVDSHGRITAAANGTGGGATEFTDLADVPASYTGLGGQYVKVKADETGLETGSPAGGADTFAELTDTPADYSGGGGKLVRVKTTEDGLEYISPPAGTGDVVGPATSTDGHLAVWDGTDSKTLKDGGAVPTGGSGGTDILMVQVFN